MTPMSTTTAPEVSASVQSPGGARPRVLSGIQPTADSFHFGNYLGALRQWVDMGVILAHADSHSSIRGDPSRVPG